MIGGYHTTATQRRASISRKITATERARDTLSVVGTAITAAECARDTLSVVCTAELRRSHDRWGVGRMSWDPLKYRPTVVML